MLKKQLGFTLLEIMVVMALVAFATTTVVLTIPNTQQLVFENQREVIAKLLRDLAQTAIQDQQWYGVYFTRSSYRAVVFHHNRWVAVEHMTAHEFENENAFTLLIDNDEVVLVDKDSTGVEVDTGELNSDLAEAQDDNHQDSSYQERRNETVQDQQALVKTYGYPQIQISPTGLVSHFELQLITEQDIVVLTDPYAFN